MKVHGFQESLDLSKRFTDAPWWEKVYRAAFPSFAGMVHASEDGWAQRGGIDRVVTLSSGKSYWVDEKVRTEDWPDVLLEYWSSVEHQRRAWVAKELACDFIAYAFVPSQTCLLLPFPILRRVWRENRTDWVARFKQVDATNQGYTTRSVAVPIDVLLQSIQDAMIVRWSNATVIDLPPRPPLAQEGA